MRVSFIFVATSHHCRASAANVTCCMNTKLLDDYPSIGKKNEISEQAENKLLLEGLVTHCRQAQRLFTLVLVIPRQGFLHLEEALFHSHNTIELVFPAPSLFFLFLTYQAQSVCFYKPVRIGHAFNYILAPGRHQAPGRTSAPHCLSHVKL